MKADATRQFAIRLPVALIRRLDVYTEKRKKETGISSLTRADVVRALLENGVKEKK
jgi:hypothetical protein